jgi:hypothetical protein
MQQNLPTKQSNPFYLARLSRFPGEKWKPLNVELPGVPLSPCTAERVDGNPHFDVLESSFPEHALPACARNALCQTDEGGCLHGFSKPWSACCLSPCLFIYIRDDFCSRFDIPINEVGKNQQPIRISHVFFVNGDMHFFKCRFLKFPQVRRKGIYSYAHKQLPPPRLIYSVHNFSRTLDSYRHTIWKYSTDSDPEKTRCLQGICCPDGLFCITFITPTDEKGAAACHRNPLNLVVCQEGFEPSTS